MRNGDGLLPGSTGVPPACGPEQGSPQGERNANRWGYAYVVCPPHYYFGKDSRPAPWQLVRQGYGRIRFAHSELEGAQMWETAVAESERAVQQLLEAS